MGVVQHDKEMLPPEDIQLVQREVGAWVNSTPRKEDGGIRLMPTPDRTKLTNFVLS
jgi:hypothetical protein